MASILHKKASATAGPSSKTTIALAHAAAGTKPAKQKITVLDAAKRQGGMGALFSKESTTFRVWAPNASEVRLAGTFDEGSANGYPLEHEGDGYWAVALAGVAAGDTYKFKIKNNQSGAWLERNDPCARCLDEESNESQVLDRDFDWEGDNFSMPSWNDVVLYELHVGTFFHKGRKAGTFDTVVEKLDYLQVLGINAITLMPPAEFPGNVSWGYNPAYLYAAEQAYGGPNGLKNLIKQAHKRGIAVLIDVVYNHIGPMEHDLWQFDGWAPEENKEGGGIYFYNDEKANTPWGHTRPDYGRPEVRQYLIDNALMWLDEYRADGLRVDSVSHIRAIDGSRDADKQIAAGAQFLQEMNAACHERFPWKLTIAEDLLCDEWITHDLADGGAGFSSQWDCMFVHPIRKALVETMDENRNMADVAKAVSFYYGGQAVNRVIYTESHDEVAEGSERVVTEIDAADPDGWFAAKRATLGIVLAATAPGIPMLFMGQEFLTPGRFEVDSSSGLDWDLAERNAGIVRMVADAFALRHNVRGQTKGLTGNTMDTLHVDEAEDMIVYSRTMEGGPGDTTVIVANFANQARIGYRIPLPEAGGYATVFNSDSTDYAAGFTNVGQAGCEAEDVEMDGKPQSALIDIGPYAVLVLVLARV